MDITELDELICQQLNQHDLAQCVRVCKKWHAVFIPYLWNDLSVLEKSSTVQQQAFTELVYEDFLHELQYQELQKDRHDTEPHNLTTTALPLRKYGLWIRQLPSPYFLYTLFQTVCTLPQPQQTHSSVDLVLDMMRHLYRQCPAIQIGELTLDWEVVQWAMFNVVAEYLVPRVRRLRLGTNGSVTLSCSKLKYLLSHCSSTLEELTLQVQVTYDEEDKEQENDQEELKPWTQLKRLTLKSNHDGSDYKAFWPWLWRHCSKVEELQLGHLMPIFESLVEGTCDHMARLNRIHFSRGTDSEGIEVILSGGHQGWKEVNIANVPLSSSIKEALMEHCSTLERLVIDGNCGFTDHEKVAFLARCPMLREFICTNIKWDSRLEVLGLRAHTFIDQDPDTGALKTWACESSLKVLRVMIIDIPRPDLLEKEHPGLGFTLPSMIKNEAYLGQGPEIQRQVYDRLARLTNLETLVLGEVASKWLYCVGLAMSLESGLHRLSRMTALKELHVPHLAMSIGVEEVQWMTEHWPKLRMITAFSMREFDKEMFFFTTAITSWKNASFSCCIFC
ncbi:MAG: hypothetical protein J3Q66DRAFT_371573 [Benniella sp.]|nr:MAG: hypothetical protein J3Q66DRAFT_371573 [Benniella sp.]